MTLTLGSKERRVLAGQCDGANLQVGFGVISRPPVNSIDHLQWQPTSAA
jgi:hypothetical protein